MPPRKTVSPPRRDPLIAVLALAGLAVAGYLAWLKWSGGTPLFCVAGTGCDIVQASRYATILGAPTAFWGALTHALVLVLALIGFDRPRWQAAFVLAAAGFGFSAYLTYLSLFELGAACVWCLASTVIMTALAIALAVRRPAPPASAGGLAALGLVCAAVAVVAGAFVFAGAAAPVTSYQQALAQHLAKSGATFYGAFWCPHCQEQKALFGGAAGSLPYVECDPKGANAQTERCERASVRVFPTWVIGSERREGVQPLDELARASGFKAP